MSKTFIELLDDIQELHEQLADKIFNEVVCKDDSWVPCSERLPKVGKYLVTWAYQNGDTEIGIDEWNDWHWCETPLHCGVIAWQPRPKPYEAEEDKEI